jgi:hypothetical protein
MIGCSYTGNHPKNADMKTNIRVLMNNQQLKKEKTWDHINREKLLRSLRVIFPFILVFWEDIWIKANFMS